MISPLTLNESTDEGAALKIQYHSDRTRVKICGLTRAEDALIAVDLGADAIGLVFYPGSPRYVGPAKACAIVDQLPAFVTTVGLFVDADPEWVRQTLERVPVDLIQFHGNEPPEYCRSFGRPWIKAFRMNPCLDIGAAIPQYAGARGFLVDAWHPVAMGGTGETFDWQLLPPGIRSSIILAGGLTDTNVSAALAAVRPYAVDVSSGVEAEKGIKDAGKMAAFFKEVHKFDYRLQTGGS